MSSIFYWLYSFYGHSETFSIWILTWLDYFPFKWSVNFVFASRAGEGVSCTSYDLCRAVVQDCCQPQPYLKWAQETCSTSARCCCSAPMTWRPTPGPWRPWPEGPTWRRPWRISGESWISSVSLIKMEQRVLAIFQTRDEGDESGDGETGPADL